MNLCIIWSLQTLHSEFKENDNERAPSSLIVDVDRLEADGVRIVVPDRVNFAAVDEVLGEVLAKSKRVAHAPENSLHSENGKMRNG